MAKEIQLTILTPTGQYFSNEVEYIHFSNGDMYLGILPNHTPLVTTLDICELNIIVNGNKHFYAVGGGIVNIEKGSKVTILTNSIERCDEIDVERALNSKKRAISRLENNKDIDIERAKKALKKANLRIEISERR